MKKLFVLVLMAATMLVACKKEESTLDISVGGSQPYSTLQEIQFFANTNSPNQVFWDFGDGNTSILPNPTHRYDVNGTYTVICTVDDDGGVVTKSLTVVVVAKYNKLKKVTVNSYWGVSMWDQENGTLPDIYYVITDANGTVIDATDNNIVYNATTPSWTWYEPLPIYKFGSYYVTVYDSDGSSSENMGTVTVNINGESASLVGEDGYGLKVTVLMVK